MGVSFQPLSDLVIYSSLEFCTCIIEYLVVNRWMVELEISGKIEEEELSVYWNFCIDIICFDNDYFIIWRNRHKTMSWMNKRCMIFMKG